MTFAAKIRAVRDAEAAPFNPNDDAKAKRAKLQRNQLRRWQVQREIAESLGVSLWDLKALFR
jgi:hypothetical protein